MINCFTYFCKYLNRKIKHSIINRLRHRITESINYVKPKTHFSQFTKFVCSLINITNKLRKAFLICLVETNFDFEKFEILRLNSNDNLMESNMPHCSLKHL